MINLLQAKLYKYLLLELLTIAKECLGFAKYDVQIDISLTNFIISHSIACSRSIRLFSIFVTLKISSSCHSCSTGFNTCPFPLISCSTLLLQWSPRKAAMLRCRSMNGEENVDTSNPEGKT